MARGLILELSSQFDQTDSKVQIRESCLLSMHMRSRGGAGHETKLSFAPTSLTTIYHIYATIDVTTLALHQTLLFN